MAVCLDDARRMLRNPLEKPCVSCVLESLRNRRAEVQRAVEQFAKDRNDSMGEPDLVGLSVSGFSRGKNLTQAERRKRGAAYMRTWRKNNERARRKRQETGSWK